MEKNMLNFNKGIVWALAGVFAFGTVGIALTARAEGPQARAIREREEKRAAAEANRERRDDKKDHPEVWAAIRAIRTARNDIEKSTHEKAKYKDSALRSIDRALADLEQLMQQD
jgi:hypothetical protein